MAGEMKILIRQTSDSGSEAEIRRHRVPVDRPEAKGATTRDRWAESCSSPPSEAASAVPCWRRSRRAAPTSPTCRLR